MRWFLAVFILLLAANRAAAQLEDPSDGVLGGTAVANRLRTAQIFQSDGKSFTRLTPSPLPIP